MSMRTAEVAREYFTSSEVAGMLGVSLRTLYRYIGEGLVQPQRWNGNFRFKRTDIDALTRRLESGQRK